MLLVSAAAGFTDDHVTVTVTKLYDDMRSVSVHTMIFRVYPMLLLHKHTPLSVAI